MLRNVLLSALLSCFVFVIGLTLALGGCGKKGGGKSSLVKKAACTVTAKSNSAADTSNTGEKIGDDAGRVGRLEEEATVTARVFYADGGELDPGKVKVMPGTWLVPGPVFVAPEGAGTAAEAVKADAAVVDKTGGTRKSVKNEAAAGGGKNGGK